MRENKTPQLANGDPPLAVSQGSPGEAPDAIQAAEKGLREELPAHPKPTLKMARSLSSLSGRFLRGSSRVVCSSSFQSLV